MLLSRGSYVENRTVQREGWQRRTTINTSTKDEESANETVKGKPGREKENGSITYNPSPNKE